MTREEFKKRNGIIGRSQEINDLADIVLQVAPSDITVLIYGESGVGKEIFARAIHNESKRSDKPLITVNSGAIPEGILESELFGHKKGAFTGAVSDKEGFMKAANEGTLFLDEIGEMPLNLQVKLLRAIQEKEYTPVGTTSSLPVNVRFIASTNKDLPEEVKNGNFREDLFYRLNVVEIKLPSLKDRQEDIPLLVNHFIDKYRKEMNRGIKGISEDAMRALVHYEWKGEVRELENVIERSIIFCNTEYINKNNLPDSFQDSELQFNPATSSSLDDSVKKYERDIIMSSLENNDFNKEKTAEELNVGLSTLYRKLKELNIKL